MRRWGKSPIGGFSVQDLIPRSKTVTFTPEQLVLDIITALKNGNGGQVTFGFRPESGPEDARTPSRWECQAQMGGLPGRDSRNYATIGKTFDEAVEKLLISIKGEI